VGARRVTAKSENDERQSTALFEGFETTTGMPLNLPPCWRHKS
jgi:hypothetical protein